MTETSKSKYNVLKYMFLETFKWIFKLIVILETVKYYVKKLKWIVFINTVTFKIYSFIVEVLWVTK